MKRVETAATPTAAVSENFHRLEGAALSVYPNRHISGKRIDDPTDYAVRVLECERIRLRRLLEREPHASERRLLPMLTRNLAHFTGRRAREHGGRRA